MESTEFFVHTKEGVIRLTFRPALTRAQKFDFFYFLSDVETREEAVIVAAGAATDWDCKVSAVLMLLSCEMN